MKTLIGKGLGTVFLPIVFISGLFFLFQPSVSRQIAQICQPVPETPSQLSVAEACLIAVLGWDLPAFYGEWMPAWMAGGGPQPKGWQADPALGFLMYRSGNPERVMAWDRRISAWSDADSTGWMARLHRAPWEGDQVWLALDRMHTPPLPRDTLRALKQRFRQLTDRPLTWWERRPVLVWHGTENQFHRWVAGLVRGDLGVSTRALTRADCHCHHDPAGLPRVGMGLPLQRSVTLGSVSLVLTLTLALFLGPWLTFWEGRWPARWLFRGMVMLDSLPVFLMGVLVLYIWEIPHFGAQQTFWGELGSAGNLQVLGVISILLSLRPAILFSRLLQVQLSALRDRPFFLTARAKGLAPLAVWVVHGLPHALPAMLALLAYLVPALIGGSVALEFLFHVEGLGLFLLESAQAGDRNALLAGNALLTGVAVGASAVADLCMKRLRPQHSGI